MNESSKISNAKIQNPESAEETMSTEAVDATAFVKSGSCHQESKQKRRRNQHLDGRRDLDDVGTVEHRRSRRESKSRRYYSDDDGDSSGSDSSEYRKRRKKRKKKKDRKERRRSKRKDRNRRKRRKRRRSYSSSSASEEDASISSHSLSSSISDKRRKKKSREIKKRRRHECNGSYDSVEPQKLLSEQEQTKATTVATALPREKSVEASVPDETVIQPKRKAMIPMSKEEYDKEQSKIREVYDPLSGRVRLVRGNGEIVERIVSSAAHRQINSLATSGDGLAFSRGIYNKLKR